KTGENDVSVEPALAWHDRGKAHSDLKSDARLFRQDGDGPKLPDQADDAVERQSNVGVAACEVRLQLVVAACVRLVAVRKAALTMRALPHRGSHGRKSCIAAHKALSARIAVEPPCHPGGSDVRFEKAFVPYGGYWSTPFVRWQGSLAQSHPVRLSAEVASRA